MQVTKSKRNINKEAMYETTAPASRKLEHSSSSSDQQGEVEQHKMGQHFVLVLVLVGEASHETKRTGRILRTSSERFILVTGHENRVPPLPTNL